MSYGGHLRCQTRSWHIGAGWDSEPLGDGRCSAIPLKDVCRAASQELHWQAGGGAPSRAGVGAGGGGGLYLTGHLRCCAAPCVSFVGAGGLQARQRERVHAHDLI
jgi:hypothetical protein